MSKNSQARKFVIAKKTANYVGIQKKKINSNILLEVNLTEILKIMLE